MIKFVSSVDDIETEEIEGRIVMQGIIQDWPTFRHPCRVMQKTENSAIVERLLANYDEVQSAWIFTDQSAGEEQVIRLSAIKAICDSAAEVNSIVRKSRESEDQFYKARERLTLEFSELATQSLSSEVLQNRA